ncbi:MAG: tryptophan synthase subunit alpha [Gammaproteobacteria bacterium]|nr:tryptophan synthase subunit alpha [Gammaproteobacteria bacterium]
MGPIEQHFYRNRARNKPGLVAYLTVGDPSMAATEQLIETLELGGADLIELCVPFPNSPTDGPTLLESHRRGLAAGADVAATLQMLASIGVARRVPVALLADYFHSVRPLGLERFADDCVTAGVEGVFVHALPPLLRERARLILDERGLEWIVSFYLNSDEQRRQWSYQHCRGMIYLVAHYGRSGGNFSFDADTLAQIKRIRAETSKPLAVGFGIKGRQELELIYGTGVDAAVIGSALVKQIETRLTQPPARIARAVGDYLQRNYGVLLTATPESNTEVNPILARQP